MTDDTNHYKSLGKAIKYVAKKLRVALLLSLAERHQKIEIDPNRIINKNDFVGAEALRRVFAALVKDDLVAYAKKNMIEGIA